MNKNVLGKMFFCILLQKTAYHHRLHIVILRQSFYTNIRSDRVYDKTGSKVDIITNNLYY